MSNGRSHRRGARRRYIGPFEPGRVFIDGKPFVAIVSGDDADDCPCCKALGQRIEADGSITKLEDVEVDQEAAIRWIIDNGEAL